MPEYQATQENKVRGSDDAEAIARQTRQIAQDAVDRIEAEFARRAADQPPFARFADQANAYAHAHPFALALAYGLVGYLIGRGVLRVLGSHLPGTQTTYPPIDD
jgi:hypothetical protein